MLKFAEKTFNTVVDERKHSVKSISQSTKIPTTQIEPPKMKLTDCTKLFRTDK